MSPSFSLSATSQEAPALITTRGDAWKGCSFHGMADADADADVSPHHFFTSPYQDWTHTQSSWRLETWDRVVAGGALASCHAVWPLHCTGVAWKIMEIIVYTFAGTESKEPKHCFGHDGQWIIMSSKNAEKYFSTAVSSLHRLIFEAQQQLYSCFKASWIFGATCNL